MPNTKTAAPPITIQALRERQRTPGLSLDDHRAIEIQISELEHIQRHANDQRAGQEAEERRDAEIARREQYNAALAEASDQADVPALALELEATINAMVAQVNALSERNQSLRTLVQDTTGAASHSADQTALLLQSIFQHMRNAGLEVRGFGPDPSARTISDVATMIQNHAAGDLRLYGRRNGYDRADWSPDALPVAAE